MSTDEADREWVRRQLARLESVYGRRRWKLLEPSTDMYDLLAESEDRALQTTVDHIARHLELATVPTAQFEWGLKMAPEVAGDIRISCAAVGGSVIRIPFFYVGKPYALGSILAHELSHHLNAVEGVWEGDRDENERLTDLSAIASGMGKLVLNGMSTEACGIPGAAFRLGYLEVQTLLYAYEVVNRRFEIGARQATAGLLPDVVSRLSEFKQQP